MKKILCLLIGSVFLISLCGCSFILQKGRRSDVERIAELSKKLDEFGQTKQLLEEKLQQEIKDKQVRLAEAEKGLVITFVADVLFDSGKAKIRKDISPTLDKVAQILTDNVPENSIGIEGHTDDEPIKYSGWKSNWELSTARALSVLHYLVDEREVAPTRVSAIGYGEYRPVAPNTNISNRQLNRRVEIVILPKVTKVKDTQEESGATPKAELIKPTGNFK